MARKRNQKPQVRVKGPGKKCVAPGKMEKRPKR